MSAGLRQTEGTFGVSLGVSLARQSCRSTMVLPGVMLETAALRLLRVCEDVYLRRVGTYRPV